MPHDRLIQAIGRMERALNRLENADILAASQSPESADLAQRHERLKSETHAVIGDIDTLLAGMDQ